MAHSGDPQPCTVRRETEAKAEKASGSTGLNGVFSKIQCSGKGGKGRQASFITTSAGASFVPVLGGQR